MFTFNAIGQLFQLQQHVADERTVDLPVRGVIHVAGLCVLILVGNGLAGLVLFVTQHDNVWKEERGRKRKKEEERGRGRKKTEQ